MGCRRPQLGGALEVGRGRRPEGGEPEACWRRCRPGCSSFSSSDFQSLVRCQGVGPQRLGQAIRAGHEVEVCGRCGVACG